jgi:hypothetical protein
MRGVKPRDIQAESKHSPDRIALVDKLRREHEETRKETDPQQVCEHLVTTSNCRLIGRTYLKLIQLKADVLDLVGANTRCIHHLYLIRILKQSGETFVG